MERFEYSSPMPWANLAAMQRDAADSLKAILISKVKDAITNGKFMVTHESDIAIPKQVWFAIDRYFSESGLTTTIDLCEWKEQFHNIKISRSCTVITIRWGYVEGDDAIVWIA